MHLGSTGTKIKCSMCVIRLDKQSLLPSICILDLCVFIMEAISEIFILSMSSSETRATISLSLDFHELWHSMMIKDNPV